MISRRFSLTLFLLLVLVFGMVAHGTASATAQNSGGLVITRVDTSQFPFISVQFSATNASGAPIQDVVPENLSIREDGTPVEITDLQILDAGVAIAILLDASGNILSLPGGSGKIRLEESRSAILDLADSDVWLDKVNRSDFVTILVPDTSGSVVKLVPTNEELVTNDYNDLHNGIYQYKPEPVLETPLFRMMFQAIKAMKDDPKTTLQRKMIIVFSDGINPQKFDDIQFLDAAAQANAANIPIHTVFLNSKNEKTQQGDPDSLRRLALLTGGQHVWYNTPEAMTPIYSQIAGLRQQYVATYRSKLNTSGKHILNTSVQEGMTPLASGSADFGFSIEPPKVVIDEPVDDTRITRVYPAYDSNPEDADPKSLDATASVTFPDGRVRNIVEYEWLSDGQPVGVTKAPEFAWNISSFTKNHTLRVRVKDELGITAESPLVNLAIESTIPAKPEDVQRMELLERYGYIPALAVALLALLFALFVWIKRPRAIMEPLTTATQTIVAHAQQVTEVFRPAQVAAVRGGKKERAFLVVTQGDTTGRRIDLLSQHTKFGRDPNLVTFVFEDRSVSRLHARISEERDGVFMLYDEGASGGTYLNYEQVKYEPVQLRDGDLINFGRVQLKFHADAGEVRGVTDFEQTEAFNPNEFNSERNDTGSETR